VIILYLAVLQPPPIYSNSFAVPPPTHTPASKKDILADGYEVFIFSLRKREGEQNTTLAFWKLGLNLLFG